MNKIYQIDLGMINEAEVYAINDIHVGSPEMDLKGFKKFINYILSKDNRYVVLVGDLVNMALKDSVSDVYGQVMNPANQIKFASELLEPIKDRILGIVGGNHERRLSKNTSLSPTEFIANKLGVKAFSDDELLLKIVLGKGPNGKRIAYGVMLHHGSGGGGRPGSALNKQEFYSMMFENVDIFVSGHVHTLTSHRYQARVADMNNNVIRYVDRLLVISGSWLSYCGYPVGMQLKPGGKGSGKFVLSGTEKKAVSVV